MTDNHAREAAEVRFSEAIFATEAIKRAAYSMADRLDVSMSSAGGEIICQLYSRKPEFQVVELAQDFRKEVLDYDLRIRVSKETEPFRNLILSLAFSKTGVQD